jgi:hypothetical protein
MLPARRSLSVFTTLAEPEHGQLLRQTRVRPAPRMPIVLPATFCAGLTLGILEPALAAAIPALQGMGIALGLGALLAVSVAEMRRDRFRRVFERTRVRRSLSGCRQGDRVRLRGKVAPGPTPPRAGTPRDATLALYVGQVRRLDGKNVTLHEVRGQDFRLQLDNHESAAIDVRGALWVTVGSTLGEPRVHDEPLWSRVDDAERGIVVFVHAEELIRPGDEIEVLGTLDYVIDPAVDRPGYRESPLGARLRGTKARPLVLRRV